MRHRRTLAIVAAAALVAGLAACSRRAPEPAGGLDTASPAVAAAAALQESLLAAPAAPAPEAARAARFYDFMNRLTDADRRDAVRDEFFRTWAADPEDPLLIELAVMNQGILGRRAELDSLLDAAAGPDTSAAMARFVAGRRAWSVETTAAQAYREAAERAAPGSLLAAWAGFRAGRILAESGRLDEGVRVLASKVGPVYACGGPALATALWSDLSRVTRRAQRLDDALVAARVAAACAEAQSDPYLRARAGLTLAMAQKERGRMSQAFAEADRTYATADEHGYVELRALAAGVMGIIAHDVGDLDGEIDAIAHMRDLAAAARDTNAVLRAGAALADAFRRRGDVHAAEAMLDSLALINRAWSAGDLTADLSSARAVLFNQVGRYAEAESLWSLAAAEGDLFRFRSSVIIAEANLMNQAVETRHPAMAYEALARARALRENHRSETRETSAWLTLELAAARLYANQGEFELAAAALDSAGAEATDLDAQSAWFVQDAAGEVAWLAGDRETAAERFGRALAVADSLGVPDRIQRSRIKLAAVRLEQGRWQDAAGLVHDELDVRSYWPRLHARLVNAMALARGGRHEEARIAFAEADTALGDDAPADLAARLLLESGRNEKALGRSREAYAMAVEARSRLDGDQMFNSDLGRTFRRGIRRDVADLTLELLRDDGDRLPVADPAAAGRAIVAWVRHETPVAADGPRIEYFVGAQRCYAWATGGGDRPWRWSDLGSSSDLRDLAGAVTTDMAYPDRDVDWAAASRLGALLYGPVLADWPAETELDIAPDDFLAALPWSALPCTAGGAPALDHGSLAIVVGAPRPEVPDPGAGRLLAIGDDAPVGSGGAVLADAEAEARAVAAAWRGGDVDLRLGSQGRLDELLAAGLTGYRAVHIATHAEVFQGPAGDATIRLGNATGAPLTVDRIAASRIGARLVFLSNCEGARRYRNRGRGVASMAEAFLDAGADRVIASSLAVEDASARTLAESFYRHWLGGAGTAAALRAAVRELRDHDPDRAHPFYWGFVGLYERPTA